MIFCDIELSRLLERTEARANAAFVEARAASDPSSGACWIEIAGAYAMFDGPESPVTQTFGLGLFEKVGDAEMERLEEFLESRGAPVFHEVSPLTDPALMALLHGRGYRPVELTSVMFRELGNSDGSDEVPGLTVRIAGPDEAELWARTSGAGWAAEMPELGDFMHGFGLVSARAAGGHAFLAEIDGVPAAAGMLFVYGGAAVLAGASTRPEYRRRGAQGALLAARLRYAAEQGAKVAVMGALPGSQSQRNAEKNGFRIAYTRTKWGR